MQAGELPLGGMQRRALTNGKAAHRRRAIAVAASVAVACARVDGRRRTVRIAAGSRRRSTPKRPSQPCNVAAAPNQHPQSRDAQAHRCCRPRRSRRPHRCCCRPWRRLGRCWCRSRWRQQRRACRPRRCRCLWLHGRQADPVRPAQSCSRVRAGALGAHQAFRERGPAQQVLGRSRRLTVGGAATVWGGPLLGRGLRLFDHTAQHSEGSQRSSRQTGACVSVVRWGYGGGPCVGARACHRAAASAPRAARSCGPPTLPPRRCCCRCCCRPGAWREPASRRAGGCER